METFEYINLDKKITQINYLRSSLFILTFNQILNGLSTRKRDAKVTPLGVKHSQSFLSRMSLYRILVTFYLHVLLCISLCIMCLMLSAMFTIYILARRATYGSISSRYRTISQFLNKIVHMSRIILLFPQNISTILNFSNQNIFLLPFTDFNAFLYNIVSISIL